MKMVHGGRLGSRAKVLVRSLDGRHEKWQRDMPGGAAGLLFRASQASSLQSSHDGYR